MQGNITRARMPDGSLKVFIYSDNMPNDRGMDDVLHQLRNGITVVKLPSGGRYPWFMAKEEDRENRTKRL